MSTQNPYPLLERADTPDQLRQLDESELSELARQLREFMVESVSKTGGHLSAGLGTVELTIALHYIFDTPKDRLIWDVGHQSYPHKILTGRRERMSTLRQRGGLAGFNKRSESEYDCFGVGHSSTSISAALGMAIAADREGEGRRVVAIIGDGAMSAGMAFEALNNAGDLDANLLVILNDNDMSISPNVGGLSNYLARVLSGKLYSSAREGSKKVLGSMPTVWELARRTEEHVKGMVVPGTLFEELGFNYIGPVDGHDLPTLMKTLDNMRSLKGPQFLHVVTTKGKGYPPAQDNPCAYHGVTKFDLDSGAMRSSAGNAGPSYTQIFGQWLCDIAERDERIVGITPAMCEGSGMNEFVSRFPERYFDVGIAEQHAVTFAAGLACEGMVPVVAIYSTFLQRAYDQLIHDVALQNLPVLFAVDRAGLVGADGATHAGAYDLSFLRCIPNITLMAPADENECRQMLYTGITLNSPAVVRYPRGTGPGVEISQEMSAIPLGKAQLKILGKKSAILAFGSMLSAAQEAAEQLGASVVNMRFIKPLDVAMILDMASNHELLLTIEENAVAGGAGSAVAECLAAHDVHCPIIHLGLPDVVTEQGEHQQLLAEYGLSAAGIIQAVDGHFASHDNPSVVAKLGSR
ncbi:MAG: 1-deoxy-D-xylulose-5-phosphate synthase [Gammaproteobacteria bacterium]|nr:1-deoxy-D-xylulose-5-phosphate synthase [Gammaproteobacteria bacterium]